MASPVFEQLGVFPDDRRLCWRSAIKSAVWRDSDEPGRISTSFALDRGRPDRRRRFRLPKPVFARPSSSASPGGRLLPAVGHHPSKALREQALRYRRMLGSATSLAVELRGDAPLSALLHGVDAVIAAQDRYLQAQLKRNGVELIRGRGVFLDAGRIEVQRWMVRVACCSAARLAGHRIEAAARAAVGGGSRTHSRQRLDLEPAVYPADDVGARQRRHRLRIRVHFRRAGLQPSRMLDKAAEPLGFLDPALRAGFLDAFRAMGGEYCGGAEVAGARFDGFSQVEVQLREGEPMQCGHRVCRIRPRRQSGRHRSRPAAACDQQPRARCRWMNASRPTFPGIFAAGDAIGPPALACAAADQGGAPPRPRWDCRRPRRPVWCRAAFIRFPKSPASGCRRARPRQRRSIVMVGRADFGEVARAHIAGEPAWVPDVALRAGFGARAGGAGARRRSDRTGSSGAGRHCRGRDRRFLHRTDLQLSDHERGISNCRVRYFEAALAAALVAAQDRGHATPLWPRAGAANSG